MYLEEGGLVRDERLPVIRSMERIVKFGRDGKEVCGMCSGGLVNSRRIVDDLTLGVNKRLKLNSIAMLAAYIFPENRL